MKIMHLLLYHIDNTTYKDPSHHEDLIDDIQIKNLPIDDDLNNNSDSDLTKEDQFINQPQAEI